MNAKQLLKKKLKKKKIDFLTEHPNNLSEEPVTTFQLPTVINLERQSILVNKNRVESQNSFYEQNLTPKVEALKKQPGKTYPGREG